MYPTLAMVVGHLGHILLEHSDGTRGSGLGKQEPIDSSSQVSVVALPFPEYRVPGPESRHFASSSLKRFWNFSTLGAITNWQ